MSALIQLVRKRTLLLFIAVLTSMLGTFLKLAPLLAIYFLTIEVMSGTPSRETIQLIIVWTMTAMALRWILLACGNSFAHVAAYNLLYDLRIEIARRLTLLPLGYVLQKDSGDLKRVLQEDIERLEMFLGHMLPDVSAAVAMIFAGGIILFMFDPVLACAAFAPLPIALGLQAILWRGAQPVMDAYFHAAGRMNANIVEFIRAIPVIKVFGRKGAAMNELKSSILDFQKIVADFSHKFVPVWAGYIVVLGSGLLFILPVGGWRLISGTTDVATFVLFMLIGVGLMQNLVEIMSFGNQMRGLLTGFQRIQDIMTAPVLETREITKEPVIYDLSFDNVSFNYENGKPVLNSLSFTCRAGQTTALVGPSGAGKSTLAQLAVRFWDPSEGAVSIGGVSLKDMSTELLNTLTASVFQDVFLFQDTIFGNIRVGRQDASRDDVINAARAAHIHDFIISLPDGYDTILGERGARLSGGQKQRISIARAILKNAPIIILDEATAYVDPLSERKIHDAIRRLCAERTVFIITHRLASIQNVHQIIVIEEGRLVDCGRHENLLKSCPLYRQLCSAWKDSSQDDSRSSEQQASIAADSRKTVS